MTLIIVQLLAGAIVSCAVFAALRVWKLRTQLPVLLCKKGRYVFLVTFLYSLPFYGIWLLGQWPGVMTQDSLYQWSTGKTLNFSADHPEVSTIYFALVQQFADSPAVIGCLQIVLTSLLIAGVISTAAWCGVPALMLLPFWIMNLVSVPIGVYNVVLWKDIPFALAVVTWGLLLFQACLRNSRTSDPLRLGVVPIALMGLSLFALTFRHGGEVCLGALLVILWVGRLFERRDRMAISGLICVVGVLSQVVIPTLTGSDQSPIPFYKSYSATNLMGALYMNDFYSPTKEEDLQVFERFVIDREHLKEYLPANVMPIHVKGVRKEISAEEAALLVQKVGIAALLNQGIFFADRAAIFFSAANEMRRHVPSLTFNNLLWNNAFLQAFEDPTVQYLATSPLFPGLEQRQRELLSATHMLAMPFQGKNLYWNALPHVLLLFGAVLFARWLPASALYAFFVIIFTGVVFLTIPTNNFRYLYFAYIGAQLYFPIVLAEIYWCRLRARPEEA